MLFALLVPLLFLAVFLAAAVRRVRVYDSFASGVVGVLPLLKSLLPYITAVLILAELFEASGLSALLSAGAHARVQRPRHPRRARAAGAHQALFGQRCALRRQRPLRAVRRRFVHRPLRERRLRRGGNGLLPLRRLLCGKEKTKSPSCRCPSLFSQTCAPWRSAACSAASFKGLPKNVNHKPFTKPP